MKKYLMLVAYMFCCVLLLCGCTREKVTDSVSVSSLHIGNVKSTVRFDGAVISQLEDQVVYTTNVDSKVMEIFVEEGSRVNSGDVLAELEYSETEDYKVIAKQTGIVTEIYAKKGECCVDGRVLSIQDDQLLCGEMFVDDNYINKIYEDQSVLITSKYDDEARSFGRVEHIYRIKIQETGLYRIEFTIEKPQEYNLGEELFVGVTLEEWEDVFLVERGAVMNSDSDCYVLVAKQQGDYYVLERVDIDGVYYGDDNIGIEGSGLR